MKISIKHNYEFGYIILLVPSPIGLPVSISLQKEKLLLKSEFHITLINAEEIAKLIDQDNASKIEAEIVTEFEDFIRVQRKERKTIVALAKVPNLVNFFERLKKKYQTNIPLQPTHVTMYTLQPEVGIGILSNEELERDSKLIEIKELKNLLFDKEIL